ncbi:MULTISPECIES: TetR/AcrR family transcriptional regulator [Mycobacterium avium complex (MAC)]|uniref:TetR family transcriptional regulator n=1 Tax=Mycobacterium avium subsp. hominissuis TaxID=439334 RepID=A0AAI8X1I6_MYCAV|nr:MULTISPECIES: TetR/AcrR family transcriptional regulator [Mycobacterium avium complex (MAC)]ETB50731.1 TetR family transcriptional regulator [Mycobacterium avium 10-5560]APT09823.1 TetR family transcriptional regulator [Mycobacterium avium subsp. hominissuis]ETZ51817.1 bacterial regulatory s, tetR family protein [Mycobacterium avium MAV_120809_2495]ETZ52395.1 bacterial regulatory s, tetR family protein [Mycobacterium sp. MAC_011194_8550]ETZ65293.1 bacterial regulatory s, tetR family protein
MGTARQAVSDEQFWLVEHSPARTRVLDAALDLFAANGVSGTSLQMIADAVGITKAAVYHQFRTKEQIVIAVTERELGRLVPALEEAEAQDDGPQARDALLVRVIEMVVRDRRLVRTLQFDPVVVRLLAEHEPFQRFMDRLYRVLLSDAGLDGRIEAAMFSGALSTAVMHPLVVDIDDETLLDRVTDLSRRLLGLPRKPVE